MKIALIGFMGSGKTLFGKALSKFLNYPFIDLDKYIEKKYNIKIPQIFEKYGEKFFRELEKKEFLNLKRKYKNLVLSVGGGFPCYRNNMHLLKKDFFVVYLYVPFEKSYFYIKNDKNRPLVKKGKKFLKKLYEKRFPIYKQAHVTLLADIPIKELIKKFLKIIKNKRKYL